MDHKKFPRIPHLPDSEGRTGDDLVLPNYPAWLEIVITEKMDGENTTLYRDGLHARSLDSKDHPSRHWLKAWHATIAQSIPENLRICGENLYAVHSIVYTRLPSYFLVFAIFEDDLCLSWQNTMKWCEKLELYHVPIIYCGPFDHTMKISTNISKYNDSEPDGFVWRDANSFPEAEFGQHIAKWVRKDHVQDDTHWLKKPIIPNLLKRV